IHHGPVWALCLVGAIAALFRQNPLCRFASHAVALSASLPARRFWRLAPRQPFVETRGFGYYLDGRSAFILHDNRNVGTGEHNGPTRLGRERHVADVSVCVIAPH